MERGARLGVGRGGVDGAELLHEVEQERDGGVACEHQLQRPVLVPGRAGPLLPAAADIIAAAAAALAGLMHARQQRLLLLLSLLRRRGLVLFRRDGQRRRLRAALAAQVLLRNLRMQETSTRG